MIIRRARRFFAIEKLIFKTGSESVAEGDITKMFIKIGDYVKEDDQLAIVEGDKGSLDVFSPFTGKVTLSRLEKLQQKLTQLKQANLLFKRKKLKQVSRKRKNKLQSRKKKQETPQAQTPKAKPQATETQAPKSPPQAQKPGPTSSQEKRASPKAPSGDRTETRENLTPVRKQVISNMKEIQETTAMLTTFQECDLGNFIDVKTAYQEIFEKKYGVKLSFMSLFYKATAQALLENSIVNSYIDGEELVHRNYIDISSEVLTPSGLVITTIRDVQNLSLPEIEIRLADLKQRAQNGNLTLNDLQTGTFTISNEGIHGSLFSIGFLNVQQSALLGIHNVENRPTFKNKQIVARPMMNLSLTYDHRIIDGKDSGTFLKTVKQYIEDPVRMILNV